MKLKQKLDAFIGQRNKEELTAKGTSRLGRSQKVSNAELIEAICRIAIPGSAAREKKKRRL